MVTRNFQTRMNMGVLTLKKNSETKVNKLNIPQLGTL